MNVILFDTKNSCRVHVIASGSSGNCVFMEAGGARILVDIGISCKRVEAGLAAIGVSPHDIDAVFVTHEHTDHVSGLRVFQKRYHKPIYSTAGTLSAVPEIGVISQYCDIVAVKQFSETAIRGAAARTFMTDHDAAEPCGVCLEGGGVKVSLATDLGYVNKAVFDHLAGSRIIVFESNYDERMLIDGGYPWHLKKRIMGRRGHLSNADSAKALLALNWDRLEGVFVAHVSRENNTHEKAFESLESVFSGEPRAPRLMPTWHERMSECCEIC